MTRSSLLHLLPLRAFHSAPETIGSPSLHSEGFVHCSPDIATTLAVANTLHRDTEEPMVALELDPDRLAAPVRWEPAAPAPPAGVPSDALFPHVYGPLERDAVIGLHYARRDPQGRYVGLETRSRTAEELDLLPHPEGGWYRRTWTSPVPVEPDGRGSRPSATAIYFLLTPGQSSAWHVVDSAEMWLWHRGGPLTLSLGGDGAVPAERPRDHVLGVGAGQDPQVLVPAGTWQRAVASATVESLVTCMVSPGFDFADFRVL
ncbi:cupin domain-containing protein [Saccharopolyspora sp. SCSIO 74807]|uniref:cupin domain-containing protein n=1 Tax=Saccharopolyspora sp. SCSIO 74807 TaxID=3118084 RepID=UPI0030D5A39F